MKDRIIQGKIFYRIFLPAGFLRNPEILCRQVTFFLRGAGTFSFIPVPFLQFLL
jgi:hypothetical protein